MKKITLLLLLISSSLFAQERFDKIDAYLTLLEKNNKFMGSLSIQEGDQLVFSKAYGLTSVLENTKANKDTKYKIGSITYYSKEIIRTIRKIS